MSYLITIMLISWPEPQDPKYKLGHCYQADTEYRPSLIKIVKITKKRYYYQNWFSWQNSWGTEYSGKIETIEHVYDVEVKCP